MFEKLDSLKTRISQNWVPKFGEDCQIMEPKSEEFKDDSTVR